MRQLTLPVLVCCLLSLCLQAGAAIPTNTAQAEFAQIARSFNQDLADLQLPALDLSFITNLKNLGSVEQLKRQKAIFAKYREQLAAVPLEVLGTCDKLSWLTVQTEIELGLQRAELGLEFLPQANDYEQAQGLHQVTMGNRWYRYFLQRWNSAAITPEQMFVFGQNQLAKSHRAYQAVQQQLGFRGDDQGLQQHLQNPALKLDGRSTTLRLFKQKQKQVWKNLPKLFMQSYGVTPARIKRSTRGADFPVPGYYLPNEKTFYYNLFEPAFDSRQADWLLLHEATPGHHFQIQSAQYQPACQQRQSITRFPAYLEGWAAYVETLGEALGLYQTPEEKLAAIEWDMVRSARVVLDVALNSKGWSDEQALEFWRQNVKGQEQIAMREIARMRRWPAQVVTYKYGADTFLRMKQYAMSELDIDIRKFHDAALAHGAMPFSVFEQLLPELVKARSD